MLGAIVRFSVRYRGLVVMLAGLLMAYGGYALSRAGLDIFPEFSPKQVVIQTEAPGLSSAQVEILVSQVIENAVGGLIGLQSVRSESIQGLSIITLVFDEETDIYRNRQLVAERLAGVASLLPAGIGPPVPVPLSSSSATILTIGVESGHLDLMELRSLVDWSLVPRILGVPGVADVNVFGGEQKQLQIRPLPDRLRLYRIGVDELVEAAGRATGVVGTGFLENRNQRITLQTSGQPVTPEELAGVVVRHTEGGNILFGDVAEIGHGAAPRIGAAAINGRPGIVMMVIGQYGANTLTVSRAVEAALAEYRPVLEQQGVKLHPNLFRPANYIETSLHNLTGHLLVGGAFVVLVLVLFLFNLRTALISAIAIPLSLLSAVIVLLEMGVNLNIMVLGGLAIALGEVVDDAIIDTENIFRRLRENRSSPSPLPIHEVVYRASMEVRGSVVYASFIVALVFVPLLTLGGVAGRLFSPLGFSYILAILASLGVALTVTPALCYLLLGRARLSGRQPPLIRLLLPPYGLALRLITRVPTLTIFGSLLLCLLGASILPMLGGRFLPELREGHYIVHTASASGTSLEESIRTGTALTRQFLQIPGVVSVSQWAGRAERGADTFGSHYSEYEVELEPMSGREQQGVLDRLRGILAGFPGILYEANTFLTERVDETISGYTSPVVVNIYGSDLDLLDRKAQAIAALMREVPGAVDVQIRSVPGTPVADVQLDHDRLRQWGLRPKEVYLALQAAFEGAVVGHYYEGNRVFDIAVVLPPEHRRRLSDIGNLPLGLPGGGVVELGQVARITQVEGRYNILHKGGQRLQTVTCNVSGREMSDFLNELRTRVLNEIPFEAGAYPEFTGAAVEQAQAREDLILHSLLAGVGVLILVYIALGSLRHVLLVLINLPFSLLGGVLAVVVTGASLSVGSMVGFVTLFGITVRNSIMLVSHYAHLVEEEGEEWNLGTAVRGAQERLPSILMTALVTALAMLPIAVDSDNPGREIMGPMAAIIIGGLASSTILNLLIMPAVMLRYGRFRAGEGT
ncbi:MAG: efflux RND transporter permease subunit [Gammaproteobacteria bacterium]|nr:MAG: efflux RND transporter permease subunit [Gammaproteobacteria bacterium]